MVALRAAMTAKFSTAPIRATFRLTKLPITNWPSISRPPSHSALSFRRHCLAAQTLSSSERSLPKLARSCRSGMSAIWSQTGADRTSRGQPNSVENDPNRSRTSLPTTDRSRSPRCLLTASCRYAMLMLLVEENGFRGMAPSCGSKIGTATQINEIGG